MGFTNIEVSLLEIQRNCQWFLTNGDINSLPDQQQERCKTTTEEISRLSMYVWYDGIRDRGMM
jgi:hypothetical protein